MPHHPFLTAQWRYLSILNVRIDPEVLRSYVPAGTELDSWRGDALASVVGFRFEDTRVLGWPVPFHRHFDEDNLRFYVRRLVDGEVRRGAPRVLEAGSQAEFITEHYWGYTRQRDGRTVEYEVRHRSWRVWSVADAELDCDNATNVLSRP
jgi:uncharacterized protein YqjF (DUF2071 family)